jgi:hypothetical protein
MFDSNQVDKALRRHDVAQVAAAIGSNGFNDPEVAAKFVTVLRQSSCLPIQIEDATSEQRRDALVITCREMLAPCPNADVKKDFEAHVADAKIVEFGYREIFRSIHNSDIWKRPQAEQAWGIILRAEREFAFVKSEIDKQLAKLAAEENPSLDPRQLKIQGEDGTWVRPDAVINGLVKNVGDTLVTLAYAHKWFEKNTGAIVIPAEVTVDDDIAFKAGNFSLAASQWRCLEHAWDRSRFYKARFRIREQEFPIKEGGTRICEVLEVSSAETIELKDRIALHRLEQVFFQSQKDLEWAEWSKATASVAVGPIPLAKAGYLSSAERVAVEVLDGNYCLPIDDDSVVIGGLPFKAWVRGYAHYAQLAHDTAGNPIFSCPRFSEEELLKGLVSAGLSQNQAAAFIRLTTFSRGVADLFDAPLLKVSDGSYRFFATAYHAPVLGVIVLSRIAWLNRRRDEQGEPANDSVFEDKGKVFEKRVLQMFLDAGIPAHGFKYKLDGAEYDCDAAVLIEDTLFLFECKNRSLPMGHLPSLHYFTLALDEAQAQVKRIAQQFTDHPEIVRAQFGAKTKWDRIVPVVLHALPWSFGCPNGVYIYDASALSHLLRKGFTSIIAEHQIGIHRLLRRHRYQLRKGKIPTAKELESEMENPNQLRLHALGWEQVAHPVQVSDAVVFSLPEWMQRTATLEEQMIALGSSPDEAAKVAKEMDEEVPTGVQKIRDGIQSRSANVKVGRNDPCPCGSGKKYKKCCLK